MYDRGPYFRSPLKLNLVHSDQETVLVNGGTKIQWTVTGVKYFFIALDYGSTVFGSPDLIFFKGDSNTAAGATVVNATVPAGVHYFIYAEDMNGIKYVKDPKIITTSNIDPDKKRKRTKR